ncbi:MAG: sigma-54 dependent transcriptional regulator [Acidobacteriota bacterium]
MTKNSVLVVDDDESTCFVYRRALLQSGFAVTTATSGDEAFELLERQRFGVMVLDHRLPGKTGLEILSELRETGRAPEVVMVSGHAMVETAVRAIQYGAFDYLTKPVSLEHLVEIVRRAADLQTTTRENVALRRRAEQAPLAGPVISESPEIATLLERVRAVAESSAPVLITGETGTGKGLFAKHVHQASQRPRELFLQVNCSALPEQLFESELFGHRKGAFTGAGTTKPGLFEVADGGTLFLDEIGEMGAAMQAKLLQVLDTGRVRPLGATSETAVDVRIVAATNRNLRDEVDEGNFREDLYYRLNVVHLELPPLRARRDDIPALVEHYLESFRRHNEKQFSPRSMAYLRDYAWPGNVRQLANLVETMTLLAPGPTIEVEDLPGHIVPSTRTEAVAEGSKPLSMAEMERLHIIRTLEHTGGLKAKAARILEIDVKTLNRKIRSYGIEVPSPG